MASPDIALPRPRATPVEALSRRDLRLGKVLLAPALTYIFLLVAIPFLLAVFLSLTNSSAGSLAFSFLGLQNSRPVLSAPVFSPHLWHTSIFPFSSNHLV